jgi:hypothetical protein
MGLRIRSIRLAIFAVLFVAMTAIPGAWYFQAPGTAFGPAISWAGGTPDETLHPQQTPTGHRMYSLSPRDADHASADSRESAPTLSDRLIALWTFVRATTLRT